MRYGCATLMSVLMILTTVAAGLADPMDALINDYHKAYEAVKPPPNSSVRADYKFDQMAMSGLYTTRSLQLLYQQNQTLLSRQEDMLKKYDHIIKQNDEIIRLLGILAGPKP